VPPFGERSAQRRLTSGALAGSCTQPLEIGPSGRVKACASRAFLWENDGPAGRRPCSHQAKERQRMDAGKSFDEIQKDGLPEKWKE
jgi:hypothetical protein